MNTNQPNHCPQCGQPISQGVKGLCPNCLALIAFGPDESVAQTVISPAVAPVVLPGNLDQTAARPLLSLSARYFGDYELQKEIARGGMGVVYKARQVSLNRTVAVKMILGGQLANETEIQRFLTEAESAANLQHPNIVAIHEVGQHEGQYYFSMDYVEGKNLADYAKANPLSAGQVAQLVKTIAEAAHYAHQRGTLHRDLKPQNVLMDANGQPRITDFGLAKRIQRDGGLTQSGAVLGSPSYMPPEQATGRHHEVGPASDVYSLGAILYQLLTGKAPFAGATPLEIIRQVVETEPIAPSKLNLQTPPDLETICLKCLEKRPERRYHSARELAEELDRFLSHVPIFARPASTWRKSWSWSQRHPWAIVGMAAIIGIVLLGLAYGLWEQVQYVRWEHLPPGPAKSSVEREGAGRLLKSPFAGWPPWFFIGYGLMFPAALYGRFLKNRQRQNLPISNGQLALLVGTGILFIALGLWSEMGLVWLHVWTHQFAWYTLVGFGLGLPFLFCWFGGIWIWQAVQTYQAHWSGASTQDTEWLPRQSLHYHSGTFLAVNILNLLIFVAVAYLAVPIWKDYLYPENHLYPENPYEELGVRLVFVFIAFVVSLACWFYARRKVNQVPRPVLIFFAVLFAGAALVWSAIPSKGFVLSAVLTGLLGGLVFVKAVKIRKIEPAEKLPPLRLGEFLQWDGKALLKTLAGVVVGWLMVAWLIFRLNPDLVFMFLLFSVWNALVPPVILAIRATTGKMREFFWVLLFLLAPTSLGAPVVGLLDPSLEVSSVSLASIFAGIAAGCALIYFGKIRPKAR